MHTWKHPPEAQPHHITHTSFLPSCPHLSLRRLTLTATTHSRTMLRLRCPHPHCLQSTRKEYRRRTSPLANHRNHRRFRVPHLALTPRRFHSMDSIPRHRWSHRTLPRPRLHLLRFRVPWASLRPTGRTGAGHPTWRTSCQRRRSPHGAKSSRPIPRVPPNTPPPFFSVSMCMGSSTLPRSLSTVSGI